MGIRTTRKDKGAAQVRKVFKQYEGKMPYVAVGILGNAGLHDAKYGGESLSNAQIGAIHEFGSSDGRIPQRSFLRGTADLKREEMKRFGESLYKQVVGNRISIAQALSLLGFEFQKLVRNRITSHIQPELAPATIKAKGSSTPLIDTGQLINSINFEIHPEG